MKTINVLGADYEVCFQTEKDNPKLKGNDGLCEIYTKKIVLDTSNENDPDGYDNIQEYYNRVFRHELFHAIFAEAGFRDYLVDETLVDALAMLYPKIKEIMEKAIVSEFEE